jgi:hypothetical protein
MLICGGNGERSNSHSDMMEKFFFSGWGMNFYIITIHHDGDAKRWRNPFAVTRWLSLSRQREVPGCKPSESYAKITEFRLGNGIFLRLIKLRLAWVTAKAAFALRNKRDRIRAGEFRLVFILPLHGTKEAKSEENGNMENNLLAPAEGERRRNEKMCIVDVDLMAKPQRRWIARRWNCEKVTRAWRRSCEDGKANLLKGI